MYTHSYTYNKETCKYERTRIQAKSVIFYSLGVAMVAALIFMLLATGFDRLTESEREAQLRTENRALDKHQIILANQLAGVELTLNELKQKDQELYQKLFEEPAAENNNMASSEEKKAILIASESEFNNWLSDLNAKSTALKARASSANVHVTESFSLRRDDLKLLNALPTLQPLANPNPDLLVSGFGMRINPFHKGKYKHTGIDFAAPRGTEVFATAAGRVIDINRSLLQAGDGNSVDIDHGFGFVTHYAHLETITVKPGQKVSKKMVIGTVGNSGGSIAPHLHYEIIHKGENVDPTIYMVEDLDSHAYNRLVSLSKKQNQSLD